MDKMEGSFPEFFPENILDKLQEIGAERKRKKLFRIGLYGENNERAWISTYEEKVFHDKPIGNKYRNDIEYYKAHATIKEFSTSTFENSEDAEYYYRVSPNLCKHFEKGVLLEAPILEEDGYILLPTEEQRRGREKSHTHLWRFEKSRIWERTKVVDWSKGGKINE